MCKARWNRFLDAHFRESFEDVLGVCATVKLLRQLQFHDTAKHASLLNMAEIDIGILGRQSLDRRLPDRHTLNDEFTGWHCDRNDQLRTIEWTFTRQDADRKLGKRCVSSRNYDRPVAECMRSRWCGATVIWR